jgi:uncharacterized protein YegJ (DUF2314 family)
MNLKHLISKPRENTGELYVTAILYENLVEGIAENDPKKVRNLFLSQGFVSDSSTAW